MNQAFTIYFFRENSSESQEAEEAKTTASNSLGLLSEIPRSEYDVLIERIENDLVAFGEFQAGEIVQNSIC